MCARAVKKKGICLAAERLAAYQMMCDVLCTVEEYGAEINVELKRKNAEAVSESTEVLAGDFGAL